MTTNIIRVARNSYDGNGNYIYQALAETGKEYLDYSLAWVETRKEAIEFIKAYLCNNPDCHAHPIELTEIEIDI